MTRPQIIETTRCPRCGAAPGMPCQEPGKRRPAVHLARGGLAEMTGGWHDSQLRPDQVKNREKWRTTRYGHR
jgi:hypothetical protein